MRINAKEYSNLFGALPSESFVFCDGGIVLRELSLFLRLFFMRLLYMHSGRKAMGNKEIF